MPAIKKAREEFGDNITIIGGGGIYTVEDGQKYLDAGADHLSLSSIMFNPVKGRKLINKLTEILK